MPPKTLLLCFIHGFKGNDVTFDGFPEHLREKVIAEAKEKEVELGVKLVVYPKYETRGDLPGCVEEFRSWLLEQVFTLEKEAGNTSPRLNPSVGVILVAHSMGGLVAADTLFTFLDSMPQPSIDARTLEPQPLFPLIQGILAFDTPYSGLSRAMFAYGAFAQYKTVTTAYGVVASLSAPLATYAGSTSAAAAVNPALAVAALGAAAYMNRERIGQFVSKEDISRGLSAVNTENMRAVLTGVSRENIEQGLSYLGKQNLGNGFTWLSSHLQFVSSLMKGAELKSRLERLSTVRGIGFANLYTSMGKNESWNGGYFVSERTFCAIPKDTTKPAKYFIKETNALAKDETDAHMTMFRPERNPGYKDMTKHAAGLVSSWARNHTGQIVDPHRNKEAEEAPTDGPESLVATRYILDDATGLKEIPATSTAMPKDRKQASSWYATTRLSSYIPTLKSRTKPRTNSTQPAAASIKAEKETETESKATSEKEEDVEAEEQDSTPQPSAADGPQEEQRAEEQAGDSDLLRRMRRESSASIPGVTEDLEFS